MDRPVKTFLGLMIFLLALSIAMDGYAIFSIAYDRLLLGHVFSSFGIIIGSYAFLHITGVMVKTGRPVKHADAVLVFPLFGLIFSMYCVVHAYLKRWDLLLYVMPNVFFAMCYAAALFGMITGISDNIKRK
jgi:hypothetical protein